jgi:hypothetical protein
VHVLDNLNPSLILGRDFLKKNEAKLDFSTDTFELDDNPKNKLCHSCPTTRTVFIITDKIILYDLHICCDSQRIKLFIFYSVVRQLFSVPVQRQTNKAYPQDNYYYINNTQKIHSHTVHRYDTDISRKHTTTQVKNNSIDYNY